MIDDPRELIAAVSQKINSSDKPAALVFNCHITGLEVARSLGTRGVPVIGLDRDDSGYGFHSRYPASLQRCIGTGRRQRAH